MTPPPDTGFTEFPPLSTSAGPGSHSVWDQSRQCWERGTQRVHPNFRPTSSRNNGLCVPRRPLLPHAAAAALQTLSLLFALAGKRRSSRYFLPSAAIPAWPAPGGTCCSISHPWDPQGTCRPSGTNRDPQRLLSLSKQVALLQRDTSSSTHTPAVHILLEKISFLLFQVPAKMRLKNVQNASFASFPLCVSVCSANRALPQRSALALTFGNKREAFILIGKQDYKLAVKL